MSTIQSNDVENLSMLVQNHEDNTILFQTPFQIPFELQQVQLHNEKFEINQRIRNKIRWLLMYLMNRIYFKNNLQELAIKIYELNELKQQKKSTLIKQQISNVKIILKYGTKQQVQQLLVECMLETLLGSEQ